MKGIIKKMKKNPKKPVCTKDDNFSITDEFEAISATECTGLIPSAPENEYSLNSYKEILPYSPDAINIFNQDQTDF